MTSIPDKECFVIMPISDPTGYDTGHFERVFKYIIEPACENASLKKVLRAVDVKNTNHIVLDILRRIITADIVICDLSSKNPNVMYELGIRQAFDLPVVLIKDSETERVFDISPIRTLDYSSSLRVDTVKRDVSALTRTISDTLNKHAYDGSSLIRLLSVEKAALQSAENLSPDTSLILSALNNLFERFSRIEKLSAFSSPQHSKLVLKLPNGENAEPGSILYADGKEQGVLIGSNNAGIVLRGPAGNLFTVPPGDDFFFELSTTPL